MLIDIQHFDETSVNEARQEAEKSLGRKITKAEWTHCLPIAKRKLSILLRIDNDPCGIRQQAWYFGEIIAETVQAENISEMAALYYKFNKHIARHSV